MLGDLRHANVFGERTGGFEHMRKDCVEQRVVAILVASTCFSTVFGASNLLGVHKAGEASGTVFDGRQPRKSPQECYVTVSPSGQWREIMVSTDRPFRANSEEAFVAGVGMKFKAISFKIPTGFPAESGGEASRDDRGYVVEQILEKRAKKAEQGGVTKLVVKYDGDENGILRDTAEITLTPEFVPVHVKVESLTKTATLNRSAKLTCEEFSGIEIESAPSAATASAPPDEQEAGTQRGPAEAQESFWQTLRELCGKAFAHVQDPPVASAPILDVRKCDNESVLFGVHYLPAGQERSWNRAQTWLITKAPDGLHMKYSRRESREPDAKQSGWSATTKDAGTAELQAFLPDEDTLKSSATLKNFRWVVRIQHGETGKATLLYQAVEKTDAGEQSRGGYLFDLSTPIAPPNDPPWGLTPEPSDSVSR